MTARLTLPARLDLTAARPLAGEIADSPGDLELDASQVTHLGGLCLQILLGARQHCLATDREFAIVNPSLNFNDAIRLFGVDPGLLDRRSVT